MSGLDRALSVAKKRFCQQTTEMKPEVKKDPETGMPICVVECETEITEADEGISFDSSIRVLLE
jgi:hypothetical protein